MLEHHPDKSPHDQLARKHFERIQEAYKVLSDPIERGFYDQWRRAKLAVPFKFWRKSFAASPPVTHWGEPEGQLKLETDRPSTDRREELRKKFRNYSL